MLIALALDQWLGEPKRHHPLVGFGQLAERVEQRLNRAGLAAHGRRLRGLLGWALLVLPLPLLILWLHAHWFGGGWLAIAVDAALLYLCIGRKSLFEHGLRVHSALRSLDLEQARFHTSMIVSRDCDQLDEAGCARATTESVLENGNDALFGALFWFALFGGAGAVLFRLANTLDAMWGYRTERFADFGWAAARLDDALNYLPARLCALCYALAGNWRQGFASWRRSSHSLSSPNGGPVMSAGAGALDVELGGPAHYHGQAVSKPFYGGQQRANANHIRQANQLIDRGLLIFMAALTGLLWLF